MTSVFKRSVRTEARERGRSAEEGVHIRSDKMHDNSGSPISINVRFSVEFLFVFVFLSIFY